MADNPNKSSARPNFHGGGAPRRGAPSNPRLMDFVDGDFRRFRNHNFQPTTRSNGRNRAERPQTSTNNRNRFEKPPSMGNRNRTPNMRNYTDRPSNGNYSGRTYYSSSMNRDQREHADNKRPESTSETQNFFEQRHNEENDVDVHSGDSYVSDINCVDQESTSFIKRDDTSEYLPNLNLGSNVNGESSRKSCPTLIHHQFSQGPAGSLHNGSQKSASENNSVPPASVASSQKFNFEGPKPDGSSNRVPLPSYFTSLPPFSELPVFDRPPNHSELLFGLPDGRRPARDNSKPTISNLPRPIKGRFSPVSNATGGLPRPITKQDLNSVNNSEAKPDLPHTVTSGALYEEWANAPEFIPKGSKPKSYAEVVNPKTGQTNSEAGKKMCPYAERAGECRMPPGCCPYLHGDICDLCGCAALHPADNNQRKQHHQKCLARHEKEMELSFAVARSKEKTCGICFEVVVEKQVHERRFGILTQCNHCFCLGCIRKWRQARQFENKVVRACPECRVTSDFVCPSVYWVETKEEKDKLIENYKNALAEKQCKYFKQGRGSCPFGNKCFYLHALPDGTKTDVGPPPRRRRNNRNRYPDDGELGDMLQQIILWDFLDEHDHHWLYSFADDIEELVAFFSDSDESESWSDYEFLLD